MDVNPSPQPCAVGEVDKNQTKLPNGGSYAAALSTGKLYAKEDSKLELCPVSIENGIPTVEFTVEEVNSFTMEEGLHQAVVIKFAYGKPALQELRQILPKLFEVKGKCNIGQLEYRHILVRFDLFEDYAKVVSRSSGYIQSKRDEFFFRTFPWTMGFNPREETSKAVVWISFPDLPANLFARKSLLSIAAAVGKPIAVDKATQERTHPSTARVKVLINLTDKHPKNIKIKICDPKSGKLVENDQRIVIDNLPKYCIVCNHQGHDAKSCHWNTDNHNVVHEGKYRLLESGRDARELLNEISANRRNELSSYSGKHTGTCDSAQQMVAISKPIATASISCKKGVSTHENISTDILIENSKKVIDSNPMVSDLVPRSKKLSADGTNNSASHARSLTTSDNVLQAAHHCKNAKISVSLKSISKTEFEHSIANSSHEKGSVSGVKSGKEQQNTSAAQAVRKIQQLDDHSGDTDKKDTSAEPPLKEKSDNSVILKFVDSNMVQASMGSHVEQDYRCKLQQVRDQTTECDSVTLEEVDPKPKDDNARIGNLHFTVPLNAHLDKALPGNLNCKRQQMGFLTFGTRQTPIRLSTQEGLLLDCGQQQGKTTVTNTPENSSSKDNSTPSPHTSQVIPKLSKIRLNVDENSARCSEGHNFSGNADQNGHNVSAEDPGLDQICRDQISPRSGQALIAQPISVSAVDNNHPTKISTVAEINRKVTKSDVYNEDIHHNDILSANLSDDTVQLQLTNDDQLKDSEGDPIDATDMPAEENAERSTRSSLVERKIANKNSCAKVKQTAIPNRRLNHNAPVYVPSSNVKSVRSFEGTSMFNNNDLKSAEGSVDRITTLQPSTNLQTNQKHSVDVNTVDMSQAKQLVTTDSLISSEEKQILEVMVNTETNSIPGSSILNNAQLTTQGVSQELPKISCAGNHIFEEGKEEDFINQCRADAAIKGDLSPMHSTRIKKSHQRERSWDGNTVEVRKPPMRNAKQKQAAQANFPKSNRLKNKS